MLLTYLLSDRIAELWRDAPIAVDVVAWSVYVGHDREPCKSGGTDRDSVWNVDSGRFREPCIKKRKEEYLYSAFLHQGTHKALRHGSHSFTLDGLEIPTREGTTLRRKGADPGHSGHVRRSIFILKAT